MATTADPLDSLVAPAPRPRANVWARLLELEDRLVAAGFPPMSPWWKRELAAWYASGKRDLIARVGRRGGKSSTFARVCVAEVLWGDFDVPPGDTGIAAIVSINKGQANERLANIEAILKAVGMRDGRDYRKVGFVIQLVGRRRAFQVFAATRAAAVGFTAIWLWGDEVALWRNEETGANPAKEILGWLKPTRATQHGAKLVLSSSPFSTLDAHHEAFAKGNTAEQVTIYAPSWVANPTLTEEGTRADERDPQEWERQYKAIPMGASAVSFFDPDSVDAAVDSELVLPMLPSPGVIVTLGGDFGFEGDASALVATHLTRGKLGGIEDSHQDIYRVAALVELRPLPGAPLKPSATVAEFATVMRDQGAKVLMADAHYRQAIVEHLETHDLAYLSAPEGLDGKVNTYLRARSLLVERAADGRPRLRLPPADSSPEAERLIRQLKQVTSQPTAAGGLSIKSKRATGKAGVGGGHGDLVSGLVLATWQRDGAECRGPSAKFGTPEYWERMRSAEVQNEQERARMEADEREVAEEETERGEREWEAARSPWWERGA